MKNLLFPVLVVCSLAARSQGLPPKKHAMNNPVMTCKLTSPELQKRKETVIASLKKQQLDKKELPDGFSYTFKGDDGVIDELVTFVKTERLCCDFFNFSIRISGNGTFAWLVITGPKGAKDFIQQELGI